MRIYFDNAASTPLLSSTIEVMTEAMQSYYGNPSSIHHEGRNARSQIERARKNIANHLNASIGEIFFTSGGTESNNMVLHNAIRDLGVERIISSPIEHHAVLHTINHLSKSLGVIVEWVSLDSKGRVNVINLESKLKNNQKKTLVSLMHINNEIGTINPVGRIGSICKDYNTLFHSDTVQSFGYFPIDTQKNYFSFLSGSAHKFHGPKGVGFVYINNKNIIKPFLHGGAQERNMRAGTENIVGIIGMVDAAKHAYNELEMRKTHISNLKTKMLEELKVNINGLKINGDEDPYGSHYKILSVSFPPSKRNEMILLNLDIAKISCSGGSACSSGIDMGSHVIHHLQGDNDWSTIRFSFSHLNTLNEVFLAVEAIKRYV